jgi:hypothetical protein
VPEQFERNNQPAVSHDFALSAKKEHSLVAFSNTTQQVWASRRAER